MRTFNRSKDTPSIHSLHKRINVDQFRILQNSISILSKYTWFTRIKKFWNIRDRILDLNDRINDSYTKKRGAIKGGTKGGRPSKKEYIQAILREESVILPPDLQKKRIASRHKQISLTGGESHIIKTDVPLGSEATVSFPKSWIQAEVSHKKNKTELNKARRQKKNYPEKWDTDEKLAKQLERNRKIMEDYQREKKIPFYEAIESGSQQSKDIWNQCLGFLYRHTLDDNIIQDSMTHPSIVSLMN